MALLDRDQRIARLASLVHEQNPLRKKLVALAVLSDELRDSGIIPILIGGTALSVYTGGGYDTKDVDLALPISPTVDQAFADLGFRKEGRFWIRNDLDLFFESPAAAALPGEDSPRTELDVDGLPVVVLGLEDLLIDRLRAWVHWKSSEDRRWTVRLAKLWMDRIDWEYVERKSADADESAAIAELRQEVSG